MKAADRTRALASDPLDVEIDRDSAKRDNMGHRICHEDAGMPARAEDARHHFVRGRFGPGVEFVVLRQRNWIGVALGVDGRQAANGLMSELGGVGRRALAHGTYASGFL